MSEDIFGCHDCRAKGQGGGWLLASGGEARDATEHPTIHRMPPTTENELAPDVSSTKVEKLF